ncbi:MAG: phosphate ABC transporter substrate-binding protein [Defluviitaleaceae bacterium]|nr:phosphate ABC transporter substrate-binding protein [Defluviitaleaceae bacterium]
MKKKLFKEKQLANQTLRRLASLSSLVILSACASEAEGTITVAGSTTVTPIMRELAVAFANETGIHAQIQEIGTSSGINATIEGASDIAMSSRALRDEELASLTPINFAVDGMAVIVNPSNPINNLSLEQVTSIFAGEITNWSEIGGNNAIITVVSREEGSGARTSFEGFVGLTDSGISLIRRDALIFNGTGGIIAAVSGNRNAIGYVTAGVLDGINVTDVSINGIRFSGETVLNGTYIFANNFYIAYGVDASEDTRAFVDFIMSTAGQAVVAAAGFVPVN